MFIASRGGKGSDKHQRNRTREMRQGKRLGGDAKRAMRDSRQENPDEANGISLSEIKEYAKMTSLPRGGGGEAILNTGS